MHVGKNWVVQQLEKKPYLTRICIFGQKFVPSLPVIAWSRLHPPPSSDFVLVPLFRFQRQNDDWRDESDFCPSFGALRELNFPAKYFFCFTSTNILAGHLEAD